MGCCLPATNGSTAWATILINFSMPAWLYFVFCDRSERGATIRKRLLKLRVVSSNTGGIRIGQALLRTAVKLLPWELVHIAAFALSEDLQRFSSQQSMGLVIANLLSIVYLVVTLKTRGRRSVHDLVADTEVDFLQQDF